jgi:parvulin-like peptidyl-prolyl isomerase
VASAYDQTRLRHPDEKEWQDTLLSQGFDPASFRKELRIQATLALLGEEEVAQASSVTDDEAEAYYDAHHDEFRFDKLTGRHLFLRVKEWGTDGQRGQRARAEGLRFRIQRGEKLADLAREFSEDETTREKGGEMPPFTRGAVPPSLEAAAFALKPGELSPVVETPAGYHIFELISRVEGGLPPYAQLTDPIKERLLRDRRADTVKRLEQQLRAKARIESYL